MVCLKRFCKFSGNSILESVIALSIISVCLYIAVMVYANVYSVESSPKFYESRNKISETFFLLQVGEDSIEDEGLENIIVVDEEILNSRLKNVKVTFKDSSSINVGQFFTYDSK